MKFKIDENMEHLAAEKPTARLEIVAFDLYKQMTVAGLLHVENVEPRMCVLRATKPRYVSDMCAVLGSVLYGDKLHPIRADIYDAFCRLVLIPDEWCEYCGSPNTYEDGAEFRHCLQCGRMLI